MLTDPATPYGSRHVPGEGPVPCRIMLIGEGPGEQENIEGAPFVGKSGQLLDRLLWQEGLKREDIYVTNMAKYHVPGNEDPTAADLARDLPELELELEAVAPEYIGLLGRVATQHFLGDIDLEWAHGLQWHRKRQPDLMPMYHPAYGLHSAEMLPLVQSDIHQFSLMVKGQLEIRDRRDQYPKPRYVLLKDKLPAIHAAQPISIDTEGSSAKPWGLSFTQKPGMAYVILAGDKSLLNKFALSLKLCGVVVLHNAMHDIPVLRAMGIVVVNFRDTMVRAYQLCTEPQGLKPLARRHASMVQDSYDDIISVPQRQKSIEYFRGALAWLAKHCPEESLTSSKASSKAKTSSSSNAGKRSKKISPTSAPDSSKVSGSSRRRR